MSGRLAGKTAFITGTGGGQGRAAALLFAREGAKVVGCDVKVEGAKETLEMVKAAGGDMVSMQPVDLGDAQQVKKWVEFGIAGYGGMDILYNNASAPQFAPVDEMTEEEWRSTIRNELDLVFLACHYAWPYLKKSSSGVILNASSVAGTAGRSAGVPGQFAHAAAKGGVVSLTKHLAIEGAPHGIRVNVICPGFIVSPATEESLTVPGFKESIEKMIPLGRLGQPEDIAKVSVFLVSDDAAYMTGSMVVVDGGISAT